MCPTCLERWPWALPAEHLLFDDNVVVVANKPAGLSLAGSDDNLVSRLLLARSGSETGMSYLCPHLHLDRDTSGVVVFAASRTASPALAHQAQQRAFSQTFVAGVVVPLQMPSQGILRMQVVRDRAGVLREVQRGRGTWVQATHRTLVRDGSRALVEVQTCDGSRAVRAMLASMGAIVAGDMAFGSEVAPRLMLHARDVLFRHPVSGQEITSVAPMPWSFVPWVHQRERVDDLDGPTLMQAIREAALRRFQLLSRGDVEAVRLLHGEAEGIVGLDVEWYGNTVVAWVREETLDATVHRVREGLEQLRPERIVVKRRPKQASRTVGAATVEPVLIDAAHDTQSDTHEDTHDGTLGGAIGVLMDASKGDGVRVQGDQDCAWVNEHGLKYLVSYGHGLSTGLFLDQRDNRRWVRECSEGAAMLNLFAYTCSFTVAAAAGGACRTVSVDASKQALDVGARNLTCNGLDQGHHVLVCDDVSRWLRRAGRAGQRFDLIVMDPPSFGTSQWGRFSTMRDYQALAAACVALLSDGGWLLACTNHRGVSVARLKEWLRRAARSVGRQVRSCELAPAGIDFPVLLGGEPHRKGIRCTFSSLTG